MDFSTLNKLSLCLSLDKICLGGNRDRGSPGTSLGRDGATPTTFIPLKHVKNPQTGLDTDGAGQSRELAARGQRGSSTKPSEDVEI